MSLQYQEEESRGKNQINYSLPPNCHRPEDIEDATLLPKRIIYFHSYPMFVSLKEIIVSKCRAL